MSLFSLERFRRKKSRPVGTTLEQSGEKDARIVARTQLLVKVAILVSLFAIALGAFPRGDSLRYVISVGDVWRNESLVAPSSFAIFKSPEEIENETAEVRKTTPAVFDLVASYSEGMLANRDTLAAQIEDVLTVAERLALNHSRGRLDEARADSVQMVRLKNRARASLGSVQWQVIIENYLARIPELPTNTRDRPTGAMLYQNVLDKVAEVNFTLSQQGVLSVPASEVTADTIIVRDPISSTFSPRPKSQVFGINDAYRYAQQEFADEYTGEPTVAQIADAFFRAILIPNLTYQEEATQREWALRISQIPEVRGGVIQGETIVERDEVIDEVIYNKLTSLQRHLGEGQIVQQYWRQLSGQALLIVCTFLLFFIYLFLLRPKIFNNNSHMLLIVLLFVFVLVQFGIAIRTEVIGLYGVPVCIVAILLTIIFDSRVGLFGILTLGFLGAHISGFDLEFAFSTIFAGSLVIFSVRDIKNRAQFFVSAGLVLVGYLCILLSAWLLQTMSLERLIRDSLFIGANATLTLLAYPLLWVFERTFNITTDVTLLEMSDTNRPILKEMSMKASGSFNHSLQVANLAEAAADAIGANALLTRVGALYHDIGKMAKPEYFVENQRGFSNPHDQLKPNMSALIIASHVKEGIEMARTVKLPQPVLDFIPEHHGTTRIEYFYRRALEMRNDGEPEIQESNFRYPGPRPQRKETGILMLADGVEAAARSLDNPTHKRLEGLIDGIIKARIDDGQLDDTELTFKDLRQIKETFLSMLIGIYHVRIKYPDQEKTSTSIPKKIPRANNKIVEELEQKDKTTSSDSAPVNLLEAIPEQDRNLSSDLEDVETES